MGSYGKGDFGGPSSSVQTSYQRGGGAIDGRSSFQQQCQAVGSNIQSLSQSVDSLKRLSEHIGQSSDSSKVTSQIETARNNASSLARQITEVLKEMNDYVDGRPLAEKRQLKMQVERLRDMFLKSLNEFKRVQGEIAQKERETVHRARAHSASSNPFAGDQDTTLVEYGQGSSGVTMQSMADETDNLAAIQEREDAIKRLEADIVDVNTIFKDISLMVHEQGDMIDSIEAHVETAADHVESGNTQLEQARDYQKKARKKKICCIVILLAILAAVAIIITIVVVSKQKK